MQRDDQGPGPEISTVGHSTHSLDHFAGLLRQHGIECLADVRLIPRSRRMPHFNDESLAEELPRHGVRYVPLKELGGRRRARPDSRNTGWRVGGFRGYADYMEMEEFQRALAMLEETARDCRTAVMCAEGLWWRCHRRLISDTLVVRGWRVTHIRPDGRTEPHRLTPFAVVEDGRLGYPGPQTELDVGR
jgi:uncharacterized protein (DUF488 family)